MASDRAHPLPPMPISTPAPTIPETNWFRKLKGGRLEVQLLAGGLRMRASGPEAYIWHLISEFEKLTGAEAVGAWKRPLPKGPKQIGGQISMVDFPGDDDET